MRRVVGTMLVASLLLVGGCGNDSVDRSRDAAVHASAVRALVPAEDPDEPSVAREVFLGGLGDDPVPIELQALVVEELTEFSLLRFVDDPEEAIDVDAEGAPVRNDGIFVRLGPVRGTGTSVHVSASRYIDEDNDERYRLEVRRTNLSWEVVDPPVPPPPSG